MLQTFIKQILIEVLYHKISDADVKDILQLFKLKFFKTFKAFNNLNKLNIISLPASKEIQINNVTFISAANKYEFILLFDYVLNLFIISKRDVINVYEFYKQFKSKLKFNADKKHITIFNEIANEFDCILLNFDSLKHALSRSKSFDEFLLIATHIYEANKSLYEAKIAPVLTRGGDGSTGRFMGFHGQNTWAKPHIHRSDIINKTRKRFKNDDVYKLYDYLASDDYEAWEQHLRDEQGQEIAEISLSEVQEDPAYRSKIKSLFEAFIKKFNASYMQYRNINYPEAWTIKSFIYADNFEHQHIKLLFDESYYNDRALALEHEGSVYVANDRALSLSLSFLAILALAIPLSAVYWHNKNYLFTLSISDFETAMSVAGNYEEFLALCEQMNIKHG